MTTGGARGAAVAGVGLRSGALPVCRDRFFGREGDIAEVAGLLAAGRLVTLTGPPGIGKSRLALEVASRTAECYPDGVRWADLTQPGPSEADLLPGAAGRDGRVLLVLDGCRDAAELAPVVDRLLRGRPGLRVLATGEARLMVAGERPWPLPPMRLPGPGEVPEAMGGYEAVALFSDRAATVAPGFGLTADTAPVVADICRRLDGMPLAIELAAAHAGVLSPTHMVAVLDDRFALLARPGTSGTAPFSHRRSLLGALEESWGRLGDAERVLLRRLGVFEGGATLAAIEEVCGGGEIERRAVFDLLGGLVAASFVSMDTAGDAARYRMLHSVRDFADRQLGAAGEASAVHARHAAWFVKLAEDAESCLLGGGDQRTCIEGLRDEGPNLAAVVRWASAGGHVEWLLRLAGAMAPFWVGAGDLEAGRRWVEAALAAAGGAAGGGDLGRLRAKVLWAAGLLAAAGGDHGRAASALGEALGVYRKLDDAQGCARCLVEVGAGLLATAGPVAALPALEESLEVDRASGDWCTARALCLCASARFHRGEVAAARALWEEAMDLARARRNQRALVVALAGLGSLFVAQGDFRAADAQLSDALAGAQDLGDRDATATALRLLGELGIERGEYDRAAELLHESTALSRDQRGLAAAGRCAQGRLALGTGRPQRAANLFGEAVDLARGEGLSSAVALLGLGRAAAALGQPEPARARLEAALAMARTRGDRLVTASILYHLGGLARLRGDHERAAASVHDAVALQGQLGLLPAVADSLEALGGLAVVGRRVEHAARLFGAAQALRDAHRFVRSGERRLFYDSDVATLRLGGDKVQAAWAQGAAMSVADAIGYASRGRGTRSRNRTGWDALSGAERAVAGLAAEGLRNKEISERLCISPRTVGSHLSKVFTKLDVSSRTQLVNHAPSPDAEEMGKTWPVPGAARS